MAKLDYQVITDKIIASLENGVVPWQAGFNGGRDKNFVSGNAYRGINTLLLSIASESKGFNSNLWLTFNQCRTLGGTIKKGSKGTSIVFWKLSKQKNEDGEIDDDSKTFAFMRGYTVFNVNQTEGLKLPEKRDFNAIVEAERIIHDMPNRPDIVDYRKPCYSPSEDTVKMPNKTAFHSDEGYYSVLFHELGHSTGHSSRLDRKQGMDNIHFGSESYAKEELVAELTSAFLCGESGITDRVINNQASYIDNWLKALKNDKRLLISASSQAQKATDYILNESTN